MKKLIAVLMMLVSPVYADGGRGAEGNGSSLTVEQCISILTGLNALNCSGMQLGGSCDKDAKSYKLGEARFTIAIAISALGPVLDAAQQAQRNELACQACLPDDFSRRPCLPEFKGGIPYPICFR